MSLLFISPAGRFLFRAFQKDKPPFAFSRAVEGCLPVSSPVVLWPVREVSAPEERIALVYEPTDDDVLDETMSPPAVSAEVLPSISAEILRLGSQDGAVDLDSPFYVRSPLEERACEAINRPGALLRIKSPHGMGKSSLAIRVLDYAKAKGHRNGDDRLQSHQRKVLSRARSVC